MTNTTITAKTVAAEAQSRLARLIENTIHNREDWVEYEAWRDYLAAVQGGAVWADGPRSVVCSVPETRAGLIHAAGIGIYVLDIAEVGGVDLGDDAMVDTDWGGLTFSRLTW